MTAEGVSFTEKEYDYAVSKGIYVIALIHGQPEQLPVAKSDVDQQARDKLAAFREKARKGRLVKSWTSSAELLQEVTLSLVHAFKVHPRAGWVRGGSTSNPELLEQINNLRQANDELRQQLSESASSQLAKLSLASAESIFVVSGPVAIGGRISKWHAMLSWNQLIGIIGPNILQPTAETYIRSSLNYWVRSFVGEASGFNEGTDLAVFDTIKVQLMAIGYIEVKSLPTKGESLALFWILTPIGRQVMLQTRTIKAPTVPKDAKP